MKKIPFLFFLFSPLWLFPQTGTIAGSAFWKYNDFIGNKADAASEVWLYRDSVAAPLKTECDFQGSFKFDNLKPGKYLIIIKSKNAKDDWSDNYIQLRYAPLSEYFTKDISSIDKSLFDSATYYQKAYSSATTEKYGPFSANKHFKKMRELNRQYLQCVKRVFSNIPKGSRLEEHTS